MISQLGTYRSGQDRCAECQEDERGAAEGGQRQDEEVLGGTKKGSLIQIGESNGLLCGSGVIAWRFIFPVPAVFSGVLTLALALACLAAH